MVAAGAVVLALLPPASLGSATVSDDAAGDGCGASELRPGCGADDGVDDAVSVRRGAGGCATFEVRASEDAGEDDGAAVCA